MKKILAIGSIALLSITSCKKSSGDSKQNIINSMENIAVAGNINARTIMEKGKLLSHFPELGMLMAFSPVKINDSASTGFDPLNNKTFVSTHNEETNEGDLLVIFNITDKEKFKATIEKQIPVKLDSREKDGFTVLSFSENKAGFSICFNDKIALFISHFDMNKEMISNNQERVDEILGYASSPKLVEQDEQIKEIIQGNNEIAMYYSQKHSLGFIKKAQEMAGQSMAQTDELMSKIENATSFFSLNAIDGELILNVKNQGFDEIKDSKYDVLGSEGINEELMSYVSANSEQILGIATMNFNMPKLIELMKEDDRYKGDREGELILSYMNYLTGEMAASISRANDKNEEPIVYIAASIKDEEKLLQMMDTNKMMKSIAPSFWSVNEPKKDIELEYEWMTAEEEEFFIEIEETKNAKNKMYIAIKNGKLFMTTDSISGTKLAKGEKLSSISLNNFSIESASKNSFFIFLNTVSQNYPDDAEEFFKNVEYIGGNANWEGSEFKISFEDKKTNGWESLFKSIAASSGGLMM